MQRSKGQASKGELWHQRRPNHGNLFGHLFSLGLPCPTKSALHTPAFHVVLLSLIYTTTRLHSILGTWYNILGLGVVSTKGTNEILLGFAGDDKLICHYLSLLHATNHHSGGNICSLNELAVCVVNMFFRNWGWHKQYLGQGFNNWVGAPVVKMCAVSHTLRHSGAERPPCH